VETPLTPSPDVAVILNTLLDKFENRTKRNPSLSRRAATAGRVEAEDGETQHAPRPSPAIRHLLRQIPEGIPIYLWSDMDYGGFNILAQLRKQVSPRIQRCLMDIATFEKHVHLSRPLTQTDRHNLKRVALTRSLKDVHPTIEHILKRGLKLEQEAIQI